MRRGRFYEEAIMAKMIEDLEAYFNQMVPPRDDLLLALEQEAQENNIPIIGPLVGQLLAILAQSMAAARILELGTATGYSAIYLARALAPGGSLVTIEQDPAMARRAGVNIEKAGLGHLVEILVGEATEKVEVLNGPFDLIFLDIDKSGYAPVMPQARRLLRPGGLLVADNVGFADARAFNQAIAADPAWQALHLLAHLPLHSPNKDGLCLAMRR
jgi:predicted O-methyltransferase YrrM